MDSIPAQMYRLTPKKGIMIREARTSNDRVSATVANITLDDTYYITDNPWVTQGLSWEGVRWSFSHAHTGNWHPLTADLLRFRSCTKWMGATTTPSTWCR